MEPIEKGELKQLLQSDSNQEVDRALRHLTKQQGPMIEKFVLKNSGSKSDAEDLFQDGLIALYKLARNKRLNEETNIEAYLYSICRNLWYKELKKRRMNVDISDIHQVVDTEDIVLYRLLSDEKKTIIQNLLKILGEKCQRILNYFYYDKLRMKKIMDLMNFANEQVVKNQKSLCMKKLRSTIMEHPSYASILKNA